MQCLEDCLALCELTEEEVLAIARHERIPEIAAAERETAKLCASYPGITVRRVGYDTLMDGPDVRYCVGLDVRAPQHQSLISGKPQPSLEGALRVAFDAARESLQRSRIPEGVA